MRKVLLFNPRATDFNPRMPNSILSIAASIDGKRDWVLVDGNLEKDPWASIHRYLSGGEFGYFACTVMPGPQLKQVIPFSRKVKSEFPHIKVIWGGYFASNQSTAVISSGYVDYVIYGPGEKAFPDLIEALENNTGLNEIDNLIYREKGEIIRTRKPDLYDQDQIPPIPYSSLSDFYSLEKYLPKTYLGKKTLAYHSSVGCPFTCSFCAVVPIYSARWKGRSANLIYQDIKPLIDHQGVDAVEFHDNNFFVSEKRTIEFSHLIKKEKINWWGEGRIDTIDKYSDASLAVMRESGCRMIFFGAETGNDAILKQMDKGGKQSGVQIRRFAGRMKEFDIIPEYSFVLGMPASTPEKVMEQIDEDIRFIKEIKSINPATEIIIYLYSPVPTEGSELFNQVKKAGFHFPTHLDDWLNPAWENFDLRKNPLTPWLTPEMVNKIRDFETVLNGYYPTVSDLKLSSLQRSMISLVSAFRYKLNWFKYPVEIKALQKFWLKYRRPEVEGF